MRGATPPPRGGASGAPPWAPALLVLVLVQLVHQASAVPQLNAHPDAPAKVIVKRGTGKFGDKCDTNSDCRFEGSICDGKAKTCRCSPDLPATNHIDKCGKPAAVNESCFFNDQCEQHILATECRDSRCVCRFERTPVLNQDGSLECVVIQQPEPELPGIDPTMIGVLVGMGLMFITLCVVMRLFSQARWRDNRTIFNTPNPRLMNASLLKQDKHKDERRGSRGSVRGPSRQPSMASLRPHSPGANGSRHGSRPESAGSSNASATSTKSLKSPTMHAGSSVQSPILESVTVEVQDQEDEAHQHQRA